MHVVMAALPSYGHVYPVMPLAEAIRDAGHRVTMATGGPPAAQLREQGWEVADVDASIEASAGMVMRDNPQLRGLGHEDAWQVATAMFAGVLPGQVAPQLAGVLQDLRPDLVVYDELDMGAALAAAQVGIPAVRHGVGPWAPPQMHERCLELLERGDGSVPEEVLGLAHIDVWPTGLAEPDARMPMARLPMRPEAWSAAGQREPDWLSQEGVRPVVYLTLGTVSLGGEADVIRTVLEGLAQLDVEVLAAVGSGDALEQLGPLPPRVRTEAFVPAARVFPLVDVVVHHGGSGTLLGALAQGRPQLALPQRAHDQFPNARVLASTGAGAALMPDELTVDAVVAAVRPLVQDDGPRASARSLAEEIAAMPAPVDVVAQLEDLVA